MVAITHDILMLVVLPQQEGLAHGIHVKRGVVCARNQVFYIVPLETDILLVGIYKIRSRGEGLAGAVVI